MPLQFTILTKSEDGPCLYWCTGAGESLQAVADTLRREECSHTLIACQSADWDRDYSPWPAPPVFGKQGFAGQGEQTLAKIRAFFTQLLRVAVVSRLGGICRAGALSARQLRISEPGGTRGACAQCGVGQSRRRHACAVCCADGGCGHCGYDACVASRRAL